MGLKIYFQSHLSYIPVATGTGSNKLLHYQSESIPMYIHDLELFIVF
jgi:hypothetical protein